MLHGFFVGIVRKVWTQNIFDIKNIEKFFGMSYNINNDRRSKNDISSRFRRTIQPIDSKACS